MQIAECRIRYRQPLGSHSEFCIPHFAFETLGGEIESRLAYTQKSEGQNLPGRPLPGCIIGSAPASDTGGPGAKPGEAANAFGE